MCGDVRLMVLTVLAIVLQNAVALPGGQVAEGCAPAATGGNNTQG